MTEKTCPASYPTEEKDSPCTRAYGHEGKHEAFSADTGLPIRWDSMSAAEYHVDGGLHRVLSTARLVRQAQSSARRVPVEEAKKKMLEAKQAYHDALFADASIENAYDAMNDALDHYDQAQDLASGGMLSELPRASVNVVRCARALMDAIRGVA